MGCGRKSGRHAGSRTCTRWCISCGGGWPPWNQGAGRGGAGRGWPGPGGGTGRPWARGSSVWRWSTSWRRGGGRWRGPGLPGEPGSSGAARRGGVRGPAEGAAELTEMDAVLDQAGPGGGDDGDGGPGGAVVISAVAGMAGVGEITLAVHWARQVPGRFSDGQLYVNLRGYDPGAAVTPEE